MCDLSTHQILFLISALSLLRDKNYDGKPYDKMRKILLLHDSFVNEVIPIETTPQSRN